VLSRIGATLGLIGIVTAPVLADENWTSFANKDGITFEKRSVGGSQYYEHRAQVVINAPPAEVTALIWRNIADAPPETVTKRSVLARTPTQVLVYDQIHSNIVSDRDVTVAIRRIDHPDHRIEIRFDTMNALGPPPDGKHVRIPVVRGSWSLTAAPNGGTQLTYICYSEPGGAVPPLLVRPTLENQVIMDVERITNRFKH
jgi:hypothetical protein